MKHFEDAVTEYEVRPARVVYKDLCQHGGVSTTEFFTSCGLKEFEVYGLTIELPDVVKVMFYRDADEDSECEGIVIPIFDVVSITWFEAISNEPAPSSGASA